MSKLISFDGYFCTFNKLVFRLEMSKLISFDGYFCTFNKLVFRVMNTNLFLHRGVRLLSGIAQQSRMQLHASNYTVSTVLATNIEC